MEISQKGKPLYSIIHELDVQFPLSISKSRFPTIPYIGTPRADVEKILDHRLGADTSYQSGRVRGAMTTDPHPVAAHIYVKVS